MAARAVSVVLLLALWGPRSTLAQDEGHACGQDLESADYGGLRPGEEVVVHRHRFVDGDPNWSSEMTRYVGLVSRVTSLSGVDAAGCPGIRIEGDGGRHFWRVRDVTTPGREPSSPLNAPREASSECRVGDENPDFEGIEVGTEVVLTRHRAVRGDDNWTEEMAAYVGRLTRVTRHAGADDQGCALVRVAVDGGAFYWRVRDLTQDRSVAYRAALDADHGRPGADPTAAPPPGIPQECAMADPDVRYGAIAPGVEVRLGRHRPVNGDSFWDGEMDSYLGRIAVVRRLAGVDDQGCPIVNVDVDGGEWFWRVRDLRRLPRN